MPWFKDEVLKDSKSPKTLMWLANGLRFDIVCCTSYKLIIAHSIRSLWMIKARYKIVKSILKLSC